MKKCEETHTIDGDDDDDDDGNNIGTFEAENWC